MNATNILDINSSCLFEIFHQIKIQCETKDNRFYISIERNTVKYADLIQFVLSCDWFRQQFHYWNWELYYSLEIGKNYGNYGTGITLDLGLIYESFLKFNKKEQDTFWYLFFKSIESKRHLLDVTIKYTSGFYYEDHLDIFNRIIELLQCNNCIKKLNVHMKGYSLTNLIKFDKLEVLHLNVKMTAEELVEYCKSNPNLCELSILNNEIYGNLADIVLDGNNIQKLQNFDFLMKTDIDAVEYKPLAKLPKLTELRIRGIHQIGSLTHFFNDLGAKVNGNLKSLFIDDAPMTDEEIRSISQIKSLKKLKLRLTETKSIGHLSQLDRLWYLDILSEHSIPELIQEFVKLWCAIQQDFMRISFPHVKEIYFRNDIKKLICTYNQTIVDASDYAAFCRIPNLRYLHIKGFNNKSGSLRNMLEGFANEMPQTLQQFSITETPNSVDDIKDTEILKREITERLLQGKLQFALIPKEIVELAAIKSLQSLNCSFADLSNIYVLAELPHLKDLMMTTPSTLNRKQIKALKQLFIALASQPNSRLEKFHLSGALVNCPMSNELVKMKSLNNLVCSFANEKSIETIQKHGHLHYLGIKSKHNDIFESILKILQSSEIGMEILWELNVSTIKCTNKSQISMDRYQNARVSRFIDLLGNGNYFTADNQYDSNTLELSLQVLAAENNSTCLEKCSMLIKYCKNDGKLILDNRNMDLELPVVSDCGCLGKLDNIQSLLIKGENVLRSFQTLFAQLAAKPIPILRELIVKDTDNKLTIRNNELMEIAQISSLKKLKCGFSTDVVNIEILGKLKELEELIITTHKYGALQGFFTSSVLRNLTIEQTALTLNVLKAIASIKSLQRLECILPIMMKMETLPNMPQLKELCIRTYEGDRVSQSLSLFINTILESLIITEDPLDIKDLDTVVQQKFLKKLHIQLSDLLDIEYLLPLTNLEELQIEICKILKPLRLPKYPQNLQKLALRNVTIDGNQFTNILELPSLKLLECCIDFEDNLKADGLEKLQVLIVRPKKVDTLKILLQALVKIKPSILKYFVIKDRELDKEDTRLLSQISSLTILDCCFKNNNFQYLAKLINLEILTIKHGIDFQNDEKFYLRALDVLKCVRDPIFQKPLKLYVETDIEHNIQFDLTPNDKTYLNIIDLKEVENEWF